MKGLKATLFLTRKNMEERLTDRTHVAAEGHEVADHTVSHPRHLKGYSSAAFLRREIEPMEAPEVLRLVVRWWQTKARRRAMAAA